MSFTLFGLQDFFREGIKSNIEVGTKKEQTTISTQETYAPQITKTYDFQYNIASEGSTVSTKKEQQVTPSQTITPSLSVIPIQSGSASPSSPVSTESGSPLQDATGLLLVGGIIAGAYFIFVKKGKKK